jgi:cell division transport system permease protein
VNISYPFRSAIKSLLKEKWINILSIFTVASNLMIISITLLFLYNADYIAKNLPSRFSMTVFFKDSLSNEEIEGLLKTLKNRSDIDSVRYISKDKAMEELKKILKNSYLLEGLHENPLLASAEIRFKKERVNPTNLKIVSEEIKKLNGVDSVQYGENIAETIYLLKKSIQNMSMIILLLISTAVIFVIYSTVKILFYRRKEEIEIMKLLGATKGFIRKPFLIEGGFIGFSGGLLVTVGLLTFYIAITYRLSSLIPLLKTLILPYEIAVSAPFFGIILGIVGSFIALGRLRL